MHWEPRTLDELRVTEPSQHHDGNDLVVHVNTEEAVLLQGAGATIAGSGCRDLERCFQRYSLEGRTYFWLAGYGSGNSRDSYPINSAIEPRLLEAMAAGRKAEWG